MATNKDKIVPFDGQAAQLIEPKEAPLYVPDDDELSLELADQWRNRFAYFRGVWHEYDAGQWVQRDIEEMQLAVRDFLRTCRRRYRLRVSNRLLNGIESLTRQDLYIKQDKIDTARNYLNLRNGLLNLDTLKLEPHRHDSYFTWQLDFDYDPDATYYTFDAYLRKSLVLDDEKPDWRMIDLVQEAMGYSLTADTSKKACFWVVGPRDSGKSTLIALLRNLMGNMHTTINLNELATNKYLLAGLAGKRVATCTEANAGSVLPDGIFKILVGGEDEIQADVKHKTPVTFVPQCKLWWGMNDMPRVLDRSGAVFSRIHMIPFRRTIADNQRIEGLLEKMTAERSGILNWMLLGLHRLRLQGYFTRPDYSKQVLADYQMRNDPEAMFINECGYLNPELRTPAKQLQDAYAAWRKLNGYQPKSGGQVKHDLKRFKVNYLKASDGRYYCGFGLNDEGRDLIGVTS